MNLYKDMDGYVKIEMNREVLTFYAEDSKSLQQIISIFKRLKPPIDISFRKHLKTLCLVIIFLNDKNREAQKQNLWFDLMLQTKKQNRREIMR